MGRTLTSGKVVLDNLLENSKPLTAKEAGGTAVIMGRLEKSGRVIRKGDAPKTGKRGRPAIKWALEPKLRKKMRDQKRRSDKKEITA